MLCSMQGFGRVAPGVFALVLASAGRLDAQAPEFTRSLSLKHRAFHHPGVPDAVVHGRRLGPKAAVDVVVFLHGFGGCALAQASSVPVDCGPGHDRVPGRGLAREHARAGGDSVLVVPQLALMRRDGSPGRFARQGGFTSFLREVLDESLAAELGPGAFGRVRRIALVAHSAGYQAALAILRSGDLSGRITDVVLLDALYGGTDEFAAWVAADARRRLISLHGASGKPARNTGVLLRGLRRKGVSVERLSAELLAGLPTGPPVARQAGFELPPARALDGRLSTPHRRYAQEHLGTLVRLLF
jgi:hypothetical protein